MGVLEDFDTTWANARATFGEGTPTGGASFDASPALRRLHSDVRTAAPGAQWTGTAADKYAATNDQHARTLDGMAGLDQRTRVEIDRAANVVTAGRSDLDSVKQWVHSAAASVPDPNSARGQLMLMPVVKKGVADISVIMQRSHAQHDAIAERLSGIQAEYRLLGDGVKLGQGQKDGDDAPGDKSGDQSDDKPDFAVGDRDDPWRYPWDPPPPPDSAPGGGRWELGQGYPPGPGGGPPMGPIAPPAPWHRDLEPPIVGGTTGLQDVVAPPPNGWGTKPPLVLKEAYRFRVTGEGFNGAADHVQWVERDGMWYQATWVDYDLQAEHVRQAVGNISLPPVGINDWQPVDIKDIYRFQVDNPRLTMYIPNPDGAPVVLDPKRVGASPG